MKKINQNRTRIVILCVLISLVAFTLYGAAQNANSNANDFDRQAMLDNIAFNIFLPLHEELVGKADELKQDVEAFAETPNTNSNK